MGTILAELLLGHLPFQGQDSTQQHLVEIMKLLGTPTDRDLQAMRATCCADDLPKLKPFPWERIFPGGTPSEAVDLAQRLLRLQLRDELRVLRALRLHALAPLELELRLQLSCPHEQPASHRILRCDDVGVDTVDGQRQRVSGRRICACLVGTRRRALESEQQAHDAQPL